MADKRLIPEGIRDLSTEALNELIDRLGTIDLTPLLIYIIDNVDKSALPHLAWQFHIEGWELAETEEEKRALIKKAIELHRYKGTRWAVKEALNALNIQADIKEWFEPEGSGEPYTFNIKLAFEKDVKNISYLVGVIDKYKNVRSHAYIDYEIIRNILYRIFSGSLFDIKHEGGLTISKNAPLSSSGAGIFSFAPFAEIEIKGESMLNISLGQRSDIDFEDIIFDVDREVIFPSLSVVFMNIEI